MLFHPRYAPDSSGRCLGFIASFIFCYIYLFYLLVFSLFIFMQHKDQCFSTNWFLEFEKMLQNRNRYLMSKNDYNATRPTPPTKPMPKRRPECTTSKVIPKKAMPAQPTSPPPKKGVPIGLVRKMIVSYLNFLCFIHGFCFVY